MSNVALSVHSLQTDRPSTSCAGISDFLRSMSSEAVNRSFCSASLRLPKLLRIRTLNIPSYRQRHLASCIRGRGWLRVLVGVRSDGWHRQTPTYSSPPTSLSPFSSPAAHRNLENYSQLAQNSLVLMTWNRPTCT